MDVVLLNRVNAFPDSKHRHCEGWCLHSADCPDFLREQRRDRGVAAERTGTIAEVAAYFDEAYGFEAGYGNSPEEAWRFDVHVQRHPCTRGASR